ncbi:hypothetical protein ANN_16500 [Periplaneta americana]|uniref:Endonuclease-reverse transcriptase n=1 Tax=Periplaneta americana TaxID=6978 RepID=A0ABQ8SQJ7_PERAM|nr:hypothetical protein ANN_16500 [Periplaneta americana]
MTVLPLMRMTEHSTSRLFCLPQSIGQQQSELLKQPAGYKDEVRFIQTEAPTYHVTRKKECSSVAEWLASKMPSIVATQHLEMYTVKDLLLKPFSSRPLEEKLHIVNKVRPTPPLPNLVQQYKTKKNLKVRIYKTVILPVLLYGCETWTLTLREEHRLRVFENKVLRKIFGAKRDEVTGEWRKLHNTELHALYSSPDIIRNIKSRRLRWAGHVARMGESRNAYRVLVGRPEGKRPLGRPRRRWEDNIKMDLREVGYDDRDWLNLAQDRDRWRAYVRAAMNLRVP